MLSSRVCFKQDAFLSRVNFKFLNSSPGMHPFNSEPPLKNLQAGEQFLDFLIHTVGHWSYSLNSIMGDYTGGNIGNYYRGYQGGY